MTVVTDNAAQKVGSAAEANSQNTRFTADQSRLIADQVADAGRQILDAYQAAGLVWLEGSIQLANRWVEISRTLLDQAEVASRESKSTLDNFAAQGRRQQETVVSLTRESGRIVQNTWLGAYRNGRSA